MADSALPVPADAAGLPPAPAAAPLGGWRNLVPGPLADFARQPALARALPALAGVGALAAAGALWLAFARGPERVLYSGLDDADRAKVVETLEAAGIAHDIDPATGALKVAEEDLYRARMLVASKAGIAAPEGAAEMLDAMPLGTSRTLEGERLRLARERELMLTIREIEGIEAVRVHLATPERSVFVREGGAPSASVMVRLAAGRSLARAQVDAIVNLVAASVPGMRPDAVRVVDHTGRLLSDPGAGGGAGEALALQREHEAKLRAQLDALLAPLLGEGNFSAEVQVALDQTETTSARETYEKEGALRSESERNATRTGMGPAGGVPGVPANTPPPQAQLVDGPPQPAAAPAPASATDSEAARERSYELGREVAVKNTRPGGLARLSVAVAVSDKALKAAAPLTAAQLEALVGAAVGADPARGDQVKVVASRFEPAALDAGAFYEQPWFALLVRYGAALLAVLLVLLFAVRPLLSGRSGKRKGDGTGEAAESAAASPTPASATPAHEAPAPTPAEGMAALPLGDLPQQVALARRLAASQPERAAEALQRMLAAPDPRAAEDAA
ncbi:MAG: flagellar basal-body MS-ring/collar protein FliF [Erythrobacter cryptus]